MNGSQHGQIMRALGRIEGQVKAMRPTIARQRGDHEALEKRTRVLENWRWYLVCLFSLTMLGAVVGFVFGGSWRIM